MVTPVEAGPYWPDVYCWRFWLLTPSSNQERRLAPTWRSGMVRTGKTGWCESGGPKGFGPGMVRTGTAVWLGPGGRADVDRAEMRRSVLDEPDRFESRFTMSRTGWVWIPTGRKAARMGCADRRDGRRFGGGADVRLSRWWLRHAGAVIDGGGRWCAADGGLKRRRRRQRQTATANGDGQRRAKGGGWTANDIRRRWRG